MQAATIIVVLDKGLEVCVQVIEISIFVGVDLLSFERLQKTLATGIVVRVRRPAGSCWEPFGVPGEPSRSRQRRTARRAPSDEPGPGAAAVP